MMRKNSSRYSLRFKFRTQSYTKAFILLSLMIVLLTLQHKTASSIDTQLLENIDGYSYNEKVIPTPQEPLGNDEYDETFFTEEDLDGVLSEDAIIDDELESDTTAIFLLSSVSKLNPLLKAVRAQTVTPKTIWLVGTSETISETYSNKYSILNNIDVERYAVDKVPSYPKGSAGYLDWLPLLKTINTEWAWILDETVNPEPDHLFYMIKLQSNFKDTLIGTAGAVLPPNLDYETGTKASTYKNIACHDYSRNDESRNVDLLFGPWLIHRSWTGHLANNDQANMRTMPLSRYISYALDAHGQIRSSLALPPPNDLQLEDQTQQTKKLCKSLQSTYKKQYTQGWTHLRDHYKLLNFKQAKDNVDQEEDGELEIREGILYIAEGKEQIDAFRPLLCRYNQPVNIAVTGGNTKLDEEWLNSSFLPSLCPFVQVFNLDNFFIGGAETSISVDLTRNVLQLMDDLNPEIIIQVDKGGSIYHFVRYISQTRGQTLISLPFEQISAVHWLSNISASTLRHWSKFKISISVVTDKRPGSLQRLLNSLKNAKYFGDSVELNINMDSTSDTVTQRFVTEFKWNNGQKRLNRRIVKAGLISAIVESWYPSDDDDYVIILEDDIEVSPLFYSWAKFSILKYRYSEENKHARNKMFGISLYNLRTLDLPMKDLVENPGSAILPKFEKQTPFLHPGPCSWGAVYFPEHWREFRSYLQGLLDKHKDYNITVPNLKSARWKKSWKKHFIELTYLRGYVMLYPNYDNFESFSTNHHEIGVHVKSSKNKMYPHSPFEVSLIQNDQTMLDQLPGKQLPLFDNLPVIDFWGELSTHENLVSAGIEWHSKISACPPRTDIPFDVSDILCPFKKK